MVQGSAAAVYSLGSNEVETDRLLRQADELAAESARLLDRVGLRPGDSAIDVGCGPLGILDLLCDRVLPGGRVVGLDADPVHTAMAVSFAATRDPGEVEVITADARQTGLPQDSFDLVHARTLLITLPAPEEVLAEMVRVARPGGHVAVLEVDVESAMCYPPHPAFDRLLAIFKTVFGRHGADLYIGRKIPGMFRRAGLTSVEVEVVAQLYPYGHSRGTVLLDLLRSMRPLVLEMRLASEFELYRLDRAARAHLTDPGTLHSNGLDFLVWGRKSARCAVTAA